MSLDAYMNKYFLYKDGEIITCNNFYSDIPATIFLYYIDIVIFSEHKNFTISCINRTPRSYDFLVGTDNGNMYMKFKIDEHENIFNVELEYIKNLVYEIGELLSNITHKHTNLQLLWDNIQILEKYKSFIIGEHEKIRHLPFSNHQQTKSANH